MQRLREFMQQNSNAGQPQQWNLAREYLQVLVLKSVFSLSASKALAFQGGTCLRICQQLKRYSEDLDFSLVEHISGYSFAKLHKKALTDLSQRGFSVSGDFSEDKIVQKSFVRIAGLPQEFGWSLPREQKLSIKIEIDVRPPKNGSKEDYFVNRFGELFPILKFDLPTLFAGKALAILCRPYDRGRDYYDLIWFLSQKVAGNFAYFAAGIKQSKKRQPSFHSWHDVMRAIANKVAQLDAQILVKDLRPFLEDPSDLEWLQNYPRVFKQLLEQM